MPSLHLATLAFAIRVSSSSDESSGILYVNHYMSGILYDHLYTCKDYLHCIVLPINYEGQYMAQSTKFANDATRADFSTLQLIFGYFFPLAVFLFPTSTASHVSVNVTSRFRGSRWLDSLTS